MNIVEVLPLEGIRIDGKTIRFSDPRERAEAVLGAPDRSWEERSYYLSDASIAVDYDEEGRVEFIEFLAGIDGEVQPEIYGVRAFEVGADELLALLEKENGPDIDDDEADYGYAFRAIGVGVYRDVTPEDVQDMLEEAVGTGEGWALDSEELAAEQRRAAHWATLGIGGTGYYE